MINLPLTNALFINTLEQPVQFRAAQAVFVIVSIPNGKLLMAALKFRMDYQSLRK